MGTLSKMARMRAWYYNSNAIVWCRVMRVQNLQSVGCRWLRYCAVFAACCALWLAGPALATLQTRTQPSTIRARHPHRAHRRRKTVARARRRHSTAAHRQLARRRSLHAAHPATVAAASDPEVADADTGATPLPAPTQATQTVAIPRHIPRPLRGSHDVLVHQNIIADVEGLGRIQNDAQIQEMLAAKHLAALPVGHGLAVDPRLPVNRRYCRPWTADFLANLAHAHSALFVHPLVVTSAVRTVQFQQHLERINGNAAPASGDTASPHLTGQAVDIGKKGMSMREIGWMRAYLGQLQSAGLLDVEEEFHQSCFHISVYKTYVDEPGFSTHMIASADAPALSDAAEPKPAAPEHRAPVRPIHHAVRRRRRRLHVHPSLMAAGVQ